MVNQPFFDAGIAVSLQKSQRELRYALRRAAELLGTPVRPVDLDDGMATYIRKHARRCAIHGVGREQPIRRFQTGADGHGVAYGLIRYELPAGARRFTLLALENPFHNDCSSPLAELWMVPEGEYLALYRHLRRALAEEHPAIIPILPPADRDRLWANTIGFLERGREALARFGVPLKRSVMLLGEPGNGKTMACRWLANEAARHGLQWRTVTAESYERFRGRSLAHMLFDLDGPGIVLFDDFDRAIRDRESFGETSDHSTFLSELDGLTIREGIVYLFTSNARIDDLDPAMRRPGRIDTVIEFRRPDATLRRRLIVENWPSEMIAGVPVEKIVASTEGFSFAEVEELKKLLVLRYLDIGAWDWPWVWQSFQEREESQCARLPIGFRMNGNTTAPTTNVAT